MKHPPKGIYLVTVVFFFAGLVCCIDLVPRVTEAMGLIRRTGQPFPPGYEWNLVGCSLGFCLICYGVVQLVRLRSAPQWAFFAMTLYLTVGSVATPAGNSPFHSEMRIYLNRFLMLIPLIAGSVYLLRPSFRAACQEFRATTDPKTR